MKYLVTGVAGFIGNFVAIVFVSNLRPDPNVVTPMLLLIGFNRARRVKRIN